MLHSQREDSLLGLSRNFRAYERFEDLSMMLVKHGFVHRISDGNFHLYSHKEKPNTIIHIFPEPCGAVNAHFGDASP
jgi:hypothetical protein